MTGKKWMIVVTEKQYNWIKEVAETTGLKGSDIVREMVEHTMNNDTKTFISGLATTQYKIELANLAEKRQEIEDKEAELKKKLKQERVAV